MTAELVLTLIGGAGFLAGVAALLQFLNTRRSTKSKGSADAYVAWRAFTTGAFEDRDREHTRVKEKRDQLFTIRGMLIDLVQDVMKHARSKGSTPADLEPFQDRLDAIRQM